jgi:hypothetical protein
MNIQVGKLYKIKPRKNLADWQYDLVYLITDIEKGKVFFTVKGETMTHPYEYTLKRFEEYLIELPE